MTANIFKYLSYLGLVLGIGLSFWVIRWGALAFLFAVACAHLAGTARAEKHASDTQESLFVILALLSQLKDKLDNANATISRTEDAVRSEETRILRQVQSGRE